MQASFLKNETAIASGYRFYRDIRFWIVCFFLLRMYGITLPPLEVGHNIRQTDGLMIARNFYERSPNILYPTIDVAGEKSGIVGSEFPILNYLIYLVSLVFGFEDWFGRLINLIVSSVGTFCFFKLIQRYFNQTVAFNATIILLVSLWFTYSRKNIPDTFAASLCLMGLYFAFRYLEKGASPQLLFYVFFSALGGLSKISSLTLLSVLAVPIFSSKFQRTRKISLVLCSIFVIVPVYLWYFLWVPYLNNKFQFSMFFMGWSFLDGLRQILNYWTGALERFYDTALKYSGFLSFLIGVYFVIRKRQATPFLIFILTFTAYLFIIIKSGSYFITNEYYILTIIPAMAFLAGWGLAQLKSRVALTIALIVISVEGIANKFQDFRIRQPYAEMTTLESILDSVSHRADLIAINGSGSGTPMFFSHRRGWISTNEMLASEKYRSELLRNGCKYILILKKAPWSALDLDYEVVYDSEYFRVYKLQ